MSLFQLNQSTGYFISAVVLSVASFSLTGYTASWLGLPQISDEAEVDFSHIDQSSKRIVWS